MCLLSPSPPWPPGAAKQDARDGSCDLQGRSRLSQGPGPHLPTASVAQHPVPIVEPGLPQGPTPVQPHTAPCGEVTEPVGSEGWGEGSASRRSLASAPSPIGSALSESRPPGLGSPTGRRGSTPGCHGAREGTSSQKTHTGGWCRGLLGKSGSPSSVHGPRLSRKKPLRPRDRPPAPPQTPRSR